MAQKYSKIPQLPGSLGVPGLLGGPHSLESPLPQGNAVLHGAFSSLQRGRTTESASAPLQEESIGLHGILAFLLRETWASELHGSQVPSASTNPS